MARLPSNDELIEGYLDWLLRERGRSAMTVHKYRYTLRNLAVQLDGRSLLHADLADMRAFVLAPVARATRRSDVGDEPMAATKKRKVAELRSFYKWLHAEGFRFDNPALRLVSPTVHNENPRPVADETWMRFWRSNRLSDTERVAFGLGYFCGLRRSEIVALAPRHFDGGKLCGFRRKGGATANLPWGSCVRLLDEKRPELGAGLMVAPLDGLLRERRNCELLVDWSGRGQVEAYMVNKRLRRALRREGMDELSFSPHQLRHSFCTNLLDVGVPLLSVSRLANHSSVTVTQRYLATAEDPLFDLLEGAE